MNDIPKIIRDSWESGSPTDWFEVLYSGARDGSRPVPWAHMQPNAALVTFLESNRIDGKGKKALVVGSGLGDDAQGLADLGFEVTAFDISQSAIEWSQERFARLNIHFEVADLLNPPQQWQQQFDFVFENRTIQSLPYDLHTTVIQNIARFVAAQGTLLVYCHGRDPEQSYDGIPWPLSRAELAHFLANDLIEVSLKDYTQDGLRRFLIEYRSNIS